MRARVLAVLVLAVAMVVGSAAAASGKSHLDPDDEIPTLSFFFDPVLATLYFDAGDEPADCSEDPLPEDCVEVEVREPVTHGAVVSSFVHALKENPDLWSGPKGQLVRQVAQSDAGKEGEPDDEGGEGEELELEEPDGADEAEDQAKPKKPKKNGPPPHAKAHGRRNR